MIPSSGFPLLPIGANPNDTSATWAIIAAKAQEYFNWYLNHAGYYVEYDATVTDYFDTIQDALDRYQKVVIGNDDTEIFLISQPLRPNDGNILEINGRLKIYNGNTSLVLADVAVGANSFRVANPEYFTVGQFAGVNDDTYPPDTSGSRRAWVGEILSVVGDTITIDNANPYLWSVSQNANAAHCQSNILIYEKDNVHICGNGIIDNNGAGQHNFRPVYGIGPAENQNAACGISVYFSTNIHISGLTLRDARMHNLAVHSFNLADVCDMIYLNKLKCYDASEKNIIVRITKNVWVSDCHVEGAKLEDGLFFYASVQNAYVNNLKALNNNRYGFGWNSEQSNTLNATNIYTEDNYRYGVYVAALNANLSNIICKDTMQLYAAEKCENININNLQFVGVNTANHVGTSIIIMIGAITDINITNLLIKDCTTQTGGAAIKTQAISAAVPIRTKINNWSIVGHTGTALDLSAGGDVTFYNPT